MNSKTLTFKNTLYNIIDTGDIGNGWKYVEVVDKKQEFSLPKCLYYKGKSMKNLLSYTDYVNHLDMGKDFINDFVKDIFRECYPGSKNPICKVKQALMIGGGKIKDTQIEKFIKIIKENTGKNDDEIEKMYYDTMKENDIKPVDKVKTLIKLKNEIINNDINIDTINQEDYKKYNKEGDSNGNGFNINIEKIKDLYNILKTQEVDEGKKEDVDEGKKEDVDEGKKEEAKLDISEEIIIKIMCNIDSNGDKTIDKEDDIAGFLEIAKSVGLNGKDEEISSVVSIVLQYLRYEQTEDEKNKQPQEQAINDMVSDNKNLPDDFKTILKNSYIKWEKQGACKLNKEVDEGKKEDVDKGDEDEEIVINIDEDDEENEEKEEKKYTEEEVKAATKIQSVYRGSKVRKDIKEGKEGEGKKEKDETGEGGEDEEEGEKEGEVKEKIEKILENKSISMATKFDIDVSEAKDTPKSIYMHFKDSEVIEPKDILLHGKDSELNSIKYEEIEIKMGDKYHTLKNKEGKDNTSLIKKLVIRDIIQTKERLEELKNNNSIDDDLYNFAKKEEEKLNTKKKTLFRKEYKSSDNN